MLLIGLFGYADHASGSIISIGVVCALPISAAAWLVSPAFAYALSFFAVGILLTGDLRAHEAGETILIPVWNACVRLFCYAAFVWLLARLRRAQETLERRVRERTAALERQTEERLKLQQELLAISERERRAFGHDLHDSVCQHLTATALAGQVMAQKLANRGLPEAGHARNVVQLIEAAISQSRSLARGLSPVDLAPGGLHDALKEFAASTSTLFGVTCTAVCDDEAGTLEPGAAMQLFCIAQEAVRNAVRHGKARNVVIRFAADDGCVRLAVDDDGKGLPERRPANPGMGLRIMSHRASVIGARFEVARRPEGGTRVACELTENIQGYAAGTKAGGYAYG